ncbi:MAG: YggT family protein [Candidatus Hydrogenedentes bacterium]|nr:YggT family protein [Candidatus Hydrogenedentota bacterium]
MTGQAQVTLAQLLYMSVGSSLLTLYMMALLLRWLAPYLEVNLAYGHLKLVSRATDPPIELIRKFLPPMGMMDFAAPAAVLAVWIVRMVLFRH